MVGARKIHPQQKLPVEANIQEFLAKKALFENKRPKVTAIGDLALVAFDYLLQVGEYTVKGKCNNTKQIVQFWLGSIAFFQRDKTSTLEQVPIWTPEEKIMTIRRASPWPKNKENGWKVMK